MRADLAIEEYSMQALFGPGDLVEMVTTKAVAFEVLKEFFGAHWGFEAQSLPTKGWAPGWLLFCMSRGRILASDREPSRPNDKNNLSSGFSWSDHKYRRRKALSLTVGTCFPCQACLLLRP